MAEGEKKTSLRVPREVWLEMRWEAIKRGVTMGQLVEELWRKWKEGRTRGKAEA